MADQLRDRGVRFVGINSNSHDTIDDIRQYLQRQSLSFPLVRDEGNVVADQFGATRTPEVFVLDHRLSVTYHGRIDDQYEPGVTRTAATRDDLRIAIEETPAGNSVSVAEEDAVDWADTSLEVIDNGRMPPWHADP